MSANLYPLAEANTFHIGEKFGVGTPNGNGWSTPYNGLLAGEHFCTATLWLKHATAHNTKCNRTADKLSLLLGKRWCDCKSYRTSQWQKTKQKQFYIIVCTKMPSMVYFFTDTAESPLISRVTGNSKVALQIQPITQQGKGLEKRARKYIEDENKFLKKQKKKQEKNKTSYYNVQWGATEATGK